MQLTFVDASGVVQNKKKLSSKTCLSGWARRSSLALSMPRQQGSKCSPRSGAAHSFSTGLCLPLFPSRCLGSLMSSLLCSSMLFLLTIVLATLGVHILEAAIDSGGDRGFEVLLYPNLTASLHPSPQSHWPGFAFDSTLGYPGEGPSPEPMGTEAWLKQLQEETCLLVQLPMVKRVEFECHNEITNRNKVVATLWCCWEKSRSSFKQVKESVVH